MFQGNYVLGEVLADLCSRSGCNLGISGEVVELPITLSVKTSSPTVLLSSIRNSLLSSGYYLQGNLTSSLSVVRDLSSDLAVYVDCFGNVQSVPKLHKSAYVKSDSIKCAIANKPVVETFSQRWKIHFYSVSETALKSYGLSVLHPLAYGSFDLTNFLDKQHISDGWNLDYLASSDSLFEHRELSFDLDSLMSFSWGTQKQIVDKTIIQDGIQTTSYVWRQYGIEVDIKSYPKMSFNYLIRSPDESTIKGNSSLGSDSTVFVVSRYDLNEHGKSCFLPFFSLFCKPTYTVEKRYFILNLHPVNLGEGL